jgi:arylsulfatase A-like enzyme
MNIMLIVLDTLRADHLGCYGYERATSPHIDRLAAEGTVFLDMVAPHIPTHPSFTTMMSGHDVFSHQLPSHSGSREPDPEIRMLAEILTDLGYYTAAADNVGRWFPRGFADYQGYDWEPDSDGALPKAQAVNDVALKQLDQCAAQDKPFFLYTHYWDPHTPYLPPKPFTRMFYEGNEKDPDNRSLDTMWDFKPFVEYFKSWLPGVTDLEYVIAEYDASIAYNDLLVAHMLTRLEELGLAEDTLVILTSDHGETMDEHDCYFDHHGLYDANLCVPLIVRCPGTIPDGQRLHGQVATYDLAPTMLDYLAQNQAIAENNMNGLSCKPLIDGGSQQGHYETLFVAECSWMRKRGVRTNQWKYIEALEPDFHDMPPVELYDLNEKPVKEVTNLVDQRPDVVKELKAKLHAHIKLRLKETGKLDPIEEGSITMRGIGA